MFTSELWNGKKTEPYTIDQSIRFNPSDNTYMHRTQDTADSKRKLTLSWWMKRGGSFGTELCLFAAGASSRFMARMHSDDKMTLRLTNSTTEKTMTTDMVFRDPSAWYHCVWIADCTTGSEFSRLYVNGSQVTMTGTQPSADTDFAGYGDGSTFSISTNSHSLSSQEWDGYLAEMVLIDNQALGPSNFGEYNDSNIWIPKDVSGLTFGTNGFYVDGRDSSDLGDDESGNGNDFTTNGLAAHDFMLDTPTNNFCVLNQISKLSYDSGQTVRGVSEANLSSISKPSGNTNGFAFGTMGVTSGKWYYEIYTTTYPAVEALGLGWIDAENAQTATASGSGWRDFGVNQRHTTSAYSVWQWGSNESTSTGLTEFQASVVVGVATDFDNNTFTLTTNGSAYGSVDFDSTSPTQDLTDGTIWLPKSELANDAVALVTFNFGQDSTFNGQISAGGNADGNGVGNFKYSVPSNHLALCTKNLGS